MHYKACRDWDVELRLYTAVDGRKTIRGVLVDFDEEKNTFIINENGNDIVLEKSVVSKVKTVFDFD